MKGVARQAERSMFKAQVLEVTQLLEIKSHLSKWLELVGVNEYLWTDITCPIKNTDFLHLNQAYEFRLKLIPRGIQTLATRKGTNINQRGLL